VTSEIQYYIIKDLNTDWKIYSELEDAFVPYIESIDSRSTSIYISINQEQYIGNGILLNFKRKSTVFINNQLIYHISRPGQSVFSIDSLKKIYGPGKLVFSIYSSKGIDDLGTSLVSYTNRNRAFMDSIDHLSIEERESEPIWNFMKIGVLVILILYVVLLNIGGRVFNDYYNIMNSFIRASTDEFLNRTKKVTRIDLVFIIVLSLVISFFIVIVLNQSEKFQNEGNLYSVGRLFTNWFWYFISIIIWIMIRFFIISISSDLFKIKAIGTIHTLEYLRITNFYSLMVFLLLVISLFVMQISLTLFSFIVLYSMIIISALRALILYLKFLNSSDFTKLYIFAYLCSAELLPVIIGLKFLLKSSLLHPVV
jgi:hypothetical protein